MDFLKLNYRLSREEMEETLLCLDWRREGKFKTVNLYITSAAGAAVLICYIRNPEQFFLFLLLILIILLLLYMVYGPAARRKRKALKLAQKGGEYRLEIRKDIIIYGEKKEKIKLSGAKNQFIFSEHICVIKAGQEVFSIPLRVLSGEQKTQLMEIAKTGQNSLVHVLIGKE